MNLLIPLDSTDEYLTQTLLAVVWIRRGLVAVAVSQVLIALALQSTTFAASGVLTLGFVAVASTIMYFIRRTQSEAALLTMLCALLIGSVLQLAFVSNALPVVTLYPALACAGIAPYVARASLLRVSIVAMISFFLLTTWKLLVPVIWEPVWFDCLQLYTGLNLTVGITLATIWLAHGRLSEMLARLRASNCELSAIKATLESQVQARTRESASSVEMLRATLEATADGILVTDMNNDAIIWNRRFTEMWHIPDTVTASTDASRRITYISTQVAEPERFVARLEQIAAQHAEASSDTFVLRDGRVFERYSQPQLLEGYGVGRVWSTRDVTQRVQAEERATIFAALGQDLSATVTVEDAARTIIGVADKLFGWDACYLDFYNPADQTLETIVCIDTLGDQRLEMPLPPASTLSFDDHRIIRKGAHLVLRQPGAQDPVDLVAFGDTSRASASMMFAPIHRGSSIIGVFSIQSYTYYAYDDADLATFRSLADHCAGALERNRSEAALRRAGEEHQQLERKMLETQKLESLGVLAGGIAHDFNNLLAVILGNLNLAQADLAVTHAATDSLKQVEIAAYRAAELTRQMLAYTGKGQRIIERIEINGLIDEMGSLLAASLPKHVRYAYEFQPDLPQVAGDATQLRQVVMNVLVNAAESIGEIDGSVQVRTSLIHSDQGVRHQHLFAGPLGEGPYLSIEVSDTGSGMDEATVRKMFEPFFTTKFTGRGLGLAAVLGIVQSHHGGIRVTSTPGSGTVFQILLPPAPATASLPSASATPTRHWHGQGTVLVVDDELDIRRLLARMLEQFGFTSILASDGVEGLLRFQEHAATLTAVLLDLTMPHMPGDQVLQHMYDYNPHVPVILMSGYTEQDAFRLVEAERVRAFLHKPFRLDDLRTILQQLTSVATAPPIGHVPNM